MKIINIYSKLPVEITKCFGRNLEIFVSILFSQWTLPKNVISPTSIGHGS
jgi:hypothetical protein